MRRLAGELGVDPIAIYHHLRGKDAVVSGVVGRVFAEMRVPDPGGKGWQERARNFARAYRDPARSHPNLVRKIAAGAAPAGTIETSEPLYAALEAAGFPPATVARAAVRWAEKETGGGSWNCWRAVQRGACRRCGASSRRSPRRRCPRT